MAAAPDELLDVRDDDRYDDFGWRALADGEYDDEAYADFAPAWSEEPGP